MKKQILAIVCCTALVLAMGATPRYLEELRIGGGLGDVTDGGADFDRAGNIDTDGDLDAGQVSADLGVFSMLTGTDALQAGSPDATAGLVQVYGGNTTQSGQIRLHTGNEYDLLVDYWTLGSGASGQFEIGGAGGSSNPGTLFQFDPQTGLGAFLHDTAVWSGGLQAGRPGVDAVQGLVTAWSGASGTAPGCVKLYSCNGTVSYVFASNDGAGLRISSTPPESDTAGAWLTTGRFRGTGSTTDAVDLATAEVAGLLPVARVASGLSDAQITDALTVWGGAINSTPVGASIASSGRFSSLTLTGVSKDETSVTWAADTQTPSVSTGNVFRIPATWTSGVYITSFTGGVEGQRILIVGGDTDCVVTDGGSLKLASNWVAGPTDTLELFFDGAYWNEISRSNN